MTNFPDSRSQCREVSREAIFFVIGDCVGHQYEASLLFRHPNLQPSSAVTCLLQFDCSAVVLHPLRKQQPAARPDIRVHFRFCRRSQKSLARVQVTKRPNYEFDFAGQHWACYHKLNRNSKHLAHKIDVVLFKPDGRGTLEGMRLARKTAEFSVAFRLMYCLNGKSFPIFYSAVTSHVPRDVYDE